MAVTISRHVESIVESGATSVVMTRQKMEGPRGIHRRKWRRVVAIIVACQGVMEPREICRRKWSRVVAVTAACQGVRACRSKFGWGS